MISNDLGEGVSLADNKLAQLCSCNASEMTDECICFQHENLAERLNSYFDNGYELVISDIPGFGVGALDHVYHGMSEEYPGCFELAPFTVITEPMVVDKLRSGQGGDLGCILDAQLQEAELIVLNKTDLISREQAEADRKWLLEHYPEAAVIAISALNNEGLEELALALKEGKASLRMPDLVYDEEEMDAAMDSISEYYIQYYAVVCCNDFDGTGYLVELADQIRDKILAAGKDIPHLKLLAWEAEGDFGKVDLLGTDREINVTRRFAERCTDIAVILNTSAACPPDKLDEIITGTVTEVSDKYQLELMIHKKEFFGLGE